MASPLSFIQNARVAIECPAGRGGPETGYAPIPGGICLVRAYLKQVSPNRRSDYADRVDLSTAIDIFEGYVIDWEEVPVGEDWKTWEPVNPVPMIRPNALRAGATVHLEFSGRVSLKAEAMEVTSAFGDRGIGQMLREQLGDRLIVKAEWGS